MPRTCLEFERRTSLEDGSGEAGVEEELAVAFHAEDGGVDEGEGLAAEGSDGVLDAVDGELVGGGVADDAAFADVLAAGFKLGLDEENCVAVPVLACGSERRDDGWENEGGGDEADVESEEGDGGGRGMGGGNCRSLHCVLRPPVEMTRFGGYGGCGVELAGGEEAGVGALKEGDAGVGAEFVVDLAVAGVDGEDGGGAVLEHAVGEAAGGGSDVGAGEAGEGEVPGGEGGFELEAAAGDVAEVVAEEADGDGVVDGGARFVDALLVDQDAAGEDERLRTLAGGGEGAVYEELVEA